MTRMSASIRTDCSGLELTIARLTRQRDEARSERDVALHRLAYWERLTAQLRVALSFDNITDNE